jgi:hypothetical protein
MSHFPARSSWRGEVVQCEKSSATIFPASPERPRFLQQVESLP